MGPQIEVDPDQLDLAANFVVSDPLAYMQLAQRYLDYDCKLSATAFGIIGAVVVSGSYDAARAQHAANAKAACNKLVQLANGLAYTAANYRITEHANTPTDDKPDLMYDPPRANGSAGISVEGALLSGGTMWALGACAMAGADALAATAPFQPAMVASVIAWGLWTPDDGELSRCEQAWRLALNAVQAALSALDTALEPLTTGWSQTNTDRRAFDSWLTVFKQEFNETVEAMKNALTTLSGLQSTLDSIQFSYLVYCLLCCMMIINLTTAPDPTGTTKIASALQGLVLNISTLGTVSAFGEALVVLAPSAMGVGNLYESTFGDFGTNVDGKGSGFQDITINWDDTYERRYAH